MELNFILSRQTKWYHDKSLQLKKVSNEMRWHTPNRRKQFIAERLYLIEKIDKMLNEYLDLLSK